MPDQRRDRAAEQRRVALHVGQRDLALRVPHPHAGHELRHVPAEPGVPVLLRGSGLAGGGAVDVRGGAGPARDHTLKSVGHEVGVVLPQNQLAPAADPQVGLAVREVDPLERRGTVPPPASRERRVRVRHLERRDRLRPERDRAHWLERRPDPHVVRRLHDRIGRHGRGDLREDGVHGERRCLQQREVAALLVGRVRELPGRAVRVARGVRDRDRGRAAPARVQRVALLDRGRERERLERRARLPPRTAVAGREVHLRDREVLPPVHRADGAVAGIDRDDRRRGIAGRGQPVGDRLLGIVLHLRIERGRDLQPAAEHLALAIRRDQIAPRVVEEVAELTGEVQADIDGVHLDRTALELGRALGGEIPLGRHLLEDVVPPLGRFRLVLNRVVERGALDHAGEQRRLERRQLGRVLLEERLRGRLDAVRAAAEVDGVQVLGQDLVLGELALDLDREQALAHLLLERARRDHVGLDAGLGILGVLTRVDVLDELLGQRRAALDDLARDEVGPRGAEDPGDVDAGVFVEPLVLDGDHRVLELQRHVRERDDRPVHRRVQGRDLVAFAVVDVGGLQRRGRLGELELRVDVEQRQQQADHGNEGHDDEHPPPAAEPGFETFPLLGGGVLATLGCARGRGLDCQLVIKCSHGCGFPPARPAETSWSSRGDWR